MATIETKQQLIEQLHKSREGLLDIVKNVPPDQLATSGVCGEWSVRDLLAHNAHWQEVHLGIWEAAQRGEEPVIPTPGHTWEPEDVDKLNEQIYRQHKDQSIGQVMDYLHETFKRFMEVVESTPEDDLFGEGVYPFTQPTQNTLIRWYIDYVEHDDWARELITQALVRK